MGLATRQRAEGVYDWDGVAERMLSVYRDMIRLGSSFS
jgi:hypothetical protein